MAADPTADDETMLATQAASGRSLDVGSVFAGRYRIDRAVGRGAMGAVYAATDQDVGEVVAIKVLTLPSEEALERFRREVRLARRVTHRNAARTYDLGEHDGVRYLTMELVSGESLADRLARDRKLEVPIAAEIGRQICEGLQAAHEVGVVHRDLKPANVLVDKAGRVVITDFGVARALSDDSLVTIDKSAMVGTPAYMAPEQVEGGTIDARTDLYAFGVMLYEMLTAKRPFEGENALSIAIARLQRDPIDPHVHTPDLPGPLRELVLACLQRAPANRPASAGEIAQALVLFRDPTDAAKIASASALWPRPTVGPSDSTRSIFAPTTLGDRGLAVLPFRYRGPADDAYLAEVLTDELVDLLSMTRGLRVCGSGATAKFADERDARMVGRELGVDAVVDGTVQRAGDRVRIAARLVGVSDGVQRWSERFDGSLEDVFDLQDRMAKRIAESLRVELIDLAVRDRAPPEVVEMYLKGRKLAREPDLTGGMLEEAIAMYDRCLAVAPLFAPALAAKADASAVRWFLPSASRSGPHDWSAIAGAAVDAALAHASEMAETHLAAARVRVAQGDFVGAAHHLSTALKIAPTYAAAHNYLGFLQCEAGRTDEGVRHIELGRELDPSLGSHWLSVLRAAAFAGDMPRYETLLQKAKDDPSTANFPVYLLEMRVAAWMGDGERVRAAMPRIVGNPDNPATRLAALVPPIYFDEITAEESEEQSREVIEAIDSPRFRAAVSQMSCELAALKGRTELAIQYMLEADRDAVLVDADWFDRCPALAPIRNDPRFIDLRHRVRARADAIWHTR